MLRKALLALATFALLLGGLEVGARWFGIGVAAPVALYIANWERQWDGDFYTLSAKPGVNSEGLRDDEHPLEKPPGAKRIAFLGDSVTFGHKLPAAQSYPAYLEQVLRKWDERTEVMNVALPGWSTHQQRIAYERIVRRYRPDHVVVGFCLNDVAELQNNLARPPRALVMLFRASNLFRAILRPQAWEIARVEELFFDAESTRVRDGWQRTFAELEGLAELVRADGASFGLLVLPFRFQLKADAPEAIPQQTLRAFAKQRNIAFLDVLPTLRRLGRRAFVDYDHLSPIGARFVALAITRSALFGSPVLAISPTDRMRSTMSARSAQPPLTSRAGESESLQELPSRPARDRP